MKMADDKDYVTYYWPDYSIFSRDGGEDWARNHIVLDSQGKIIGFTGGFADFKADQVYNYKDGHTGLGWHKTGTNACYKHKTKKGEYIDMFATTGNFWDAVVESINSDFEIDVKEVKQMFGVKQIVDKFFDTIQKYGKEHLPGNLSIYTGDVAGIFKNLLGGAGDDIVEIIKAGVESYNARPENKDKQIVWDGEHIKIGDLFVSLVGYLYAAVEIITVAIIMNFIQELKKKKDEWIAERNEPSIYKKYGTINIKDEMHYQQYEDHAPGLANQTDLYSKYLMTNLQTQLGLGWKDI